MLEIAHRNSDVFVVYVNIDMKIRVPVTTSKYFLSRITSGNRTVIPKVTHSIPKKTEQRSKERFAILQFNFVENKKQIQVNESQPHRLSFGIICWYLPCKVQIRHCSTERNNSIYTEKPVHLFSGIFDTEEKSENDFFKNLFKKKLIVEIADGYENYFHGECHANSFVI